MAETDKLESCWTSLAISPWF